MLSCSHLNYNYIPKYVVTFHWLRNFALVWSPCWCSHFWSFDSTSPYSVDIGCLVGIIKVAQGQYSFDYIWLIMFFTVSYIVYNGRPIVTDKWRYTILSFAWRGRRKSWDMLDSIWVIDEGVAFFFKVCIFFLCYLQISLRTLLIS